jgi:hypothetical protein
VQDRGGSILETQTMPKSNFTIVQGTMSVTEFGNSVPYTGKLDDLSEQPVLEIINKVLKHDAKKVFDIAAFDQFNLAPAARRAHQRHRHGRDHAHHERHLHHRPTTSRCARAT